MASVLEVAWNFVFAAPEDVLVDDDEVCGFGVVGNLPLALQPVDELRQLDAPRLGALLTEK